MRKGTHPLLQRAGDDLAAAKLTGMPGYPFGQHIQAAIEKYLKALLLETTGDFPLTHNLELLASLAAKQELTLPDLGDVSLDLLTSYAGNFRYEDEEIIPVLDRAKCIAAVEAIKAYVDGQLK